LTVYDSGLFGKELPEEWMNYTRARECFVNSISNDKYEYVLVVRRSREDSVIFDQFIRD